MRQLLQINLKTARVSSKNIDFWCQFQNLFKFIFKLTEHQAIKLIITLFDHNVRRNNEQNGKILK